jgi:uncharacterized protein (TIGR04222 family)
MTNPLDWTAGPFLSLYVLLALIAGIFVVMGRRSLGPPALRTQDHDLGLLDLAWLAGGRDQVADTVMLAFLTAGAAAFDSNAGLVILPEPDPVVVPSEVEPFRGVAAGSWTRRRFHQAVWLQVERVAILPQRWQRCWRWHLLTAQAESDFERAAKGHPSLLKIINVSGGEAIQIVVNIIPHYFFH